MKLNWLFPVIGLVMLMASCATMVSDGSGSTTETGLVMGMVYEPDGKTPAIGAMVHIRPKASVAMVTAGGQSGSGTTDSALTDTNGKFTFDTSLAIGSYVVEAVEGANAAIIRPVDVVSKSSLLTLAPVTLKPTGSISGSVELIGGGDPENVYVLVFGVNRFARLRADGSFVLSSLAEGVYDLKVITILKGYAAFDTTGIPVVSADTTRLQAFRLPYNGIPVPVISIATDSVKKIAIVSWHVGEAPAVKSYNVYRIVIDSSNCSTYQDDTLIINPNQNLDIPTKAFWQINITQITDTVYYDSMVSNHWRYVYRVTAVDANGNEGSPGTSDIVKVGSVYKLVKSITPQPVASLSKIIGSDLTISLQTTDIILVNYCVPQHNRVMTYSRDGSLNSEWEFTDSTPKGYYGQVFSSDVHGNWYIVTDDRQGFYKYDSTGKTVWHYDSSAWWIDGLYVEESGIVYCNYSYELAGYEYFIAKVSSEGKFLKSWRTDLRLDQKIAVKNSKIYCTGTRNFNGLSWQVEQGMDNSDHVLEIMDTSGILLQTVPLKSHGYLGRTGMFDIAIDKNDNLYLLGIMDSYGSKLFLTMQIFTEQLELTAQFDFGPSYQTKIQPYGIQVADDGIIWMWGETDFGEDYKPSSWVIQQYQRN